MTEAGWTSRASCSSRPTTVSGPANQRWLAVFLRFDRQLSDPRTDGDAQQVYFTEVLG